MDDLDLLHYLFLHHHLYGHLLDHLDNPDDLLLHHHNLAGYLHLLHHLLETSTGTSTTTVLTTSFSTSTILSTGTSLMTSLSTILSTGTSLIDSSAAIPPQKPQPLPLADDARNVPDDERDEEKRRGWSGHAGRPD